MRCRQVSKVKFDLQSRSLKQLVSDIENVSSSKSLRVRLIVLHYISYYF